MNAFLSLGVDGTVILLPFGASNFACLAPLTHCQPLRINLATNFCISLLLLNLFMANKWAQGPLPIYLLFLAAARCALAAKLPLATCPPLAFAWAP